MNFFAQVVPALAIYSSLCPLDMYFFFFFQHFLTFWPHKIFCAHLVFLMSQPWKQPFLQGILVTFMEEWYFETKICVLGVLIVSVVSWPELSVMGLNSYLKN